jgi:ubiquitin C-terminal hydrolase
MNNISVSNKETEVINVEKYIPGNSGLINSGNSCYMNATIQTISHLYMFKQHFLHNEDVIVNTILKNAPKFFSNIKYDDIKVKISKSDYTPQSLTLEEKSIIVNSTITYQIIKVLKGLWSDNVSSNSIQQKNVVINPISFKKIFSEARHNFFLGRDQHDAEEAYNCIMQKIQEELATTTNTRIRTEKVSVNELLDFKQETKIKIEKSKSEKEKQEFLYKCDEKKKAMPEENLILKSFKEMKKYYDVSKSIITNYFSGFLHSSMSCPDIMCKHVTDNFEPYLQLSFSIPDGENITIYDCMNEYCKEEILDDDNLWYCRGCKKNVKGVKKIDLWTNPKNLVIQLKRFDRQLSRKNNRMVHCPITNLNIESMISPINMESMHNKFFMYDLQCVVNHDGGIHGGHYFSYCKDRNTNAWYKYNDEKVAPLSDGCIVTRMAYMLFYVRRDIF